MNNPLYLNSEFITTDKTIPVRTPATGETIAQMSACGRDRVAQALTDAHAFQAAGGRQEVGED